VSWRHRLFPTHPERSAALAARGWRVLLYLGRKSLREDAIGRLSASLALQTLLSIVPLLGVVLALVSALGGDGAQALLVRLTAALAPP